MLTLPEVQHGPVQDSPVHNSFDEEKLLVYRELYYDGFSSIIAARDLTSGAAVSVKKVEFNFMKPSPFPVRYLQKLFAKKIRKQAEQMRSLSHSSLLKVMEFVVEPKRTIVVTEMCMFGDMFNWMLQQAQLRVRDICLVIQYVFQALRYLHSQDYVHGHLMPTHILFQSMSPQSVTIMPDLSVRSELIDMTIKSPPVIDCWAPELIKQFIEHQKQLPVEISDKKISIERTKAMDVWSAGVIAHLALTGRPPFQASGLQNTLDEIESFGGDLKHPIIQTLSPTVQESLKKFLCVDSTKRAVADYGAEPLWFDDELTRLDNRNFLITTEYDLMHSCRRYRQQGRDVFEHVFCPNSTVSDPLATNLVRECESIK
ncbi:unnamed protein product [Calicophoron daubneyi]|uniref:Protein kinase domain-containing protein n=1 Tax=Calicophoron daubneyi TaxID=300641 RepID=A0AAV2T6R2_CALDB